LQGAPDPDRRRELQRILYGLYAVIRLHFAKEEELYLPLLDAGLGSAEAAEMFRAMHESAHSSGSADHEPAHH
jgi:iron-sulfur cluster repair protein YtfE (RIC family)